MEQAYGGGPALSPAEIKRDEFRGARSFQLLGGVTSPRIGWWQWWQHFRLNPSKPLYLGLETSRNHHKPLLSSASDSPARYDMKAGVLVQSTVPRKYRDIQKCPVRTLGRWDRQMAWCNISVNISSLCPPPVQDQWVQTSRSTSSLWAFSELPPSWPQNQGHSHWSGCHRWLNNVGICWICPPK